MVKKKFTIVWTLKAEKSLGDIYNFYKNKSIQGAFNVINDIVKSPTNIVFSEQFQIDDVNLKYRRIIVRDYKVLYRETDNEIIIVDVICTLMNPKQFE